MTSNGTGTLVFIDDVTEADRLIGILSAQIQPNSADWMVLHITDGP